MAAKKKRTRRPKPLTVVDAVRRDLAALKKRAPVLAESSLAASALVLARALDDPKNSATSKSMCARSLIETTDRLRELAPDGEEKDQLDELNARRAAKAQRKSAAAH